MWMANKFTTNRPRDPVERFTPTAPLMHAIVMLVIMVGLLISITTADTALAYIDTASRISYYQQYKDATYVGENVATGPFTSGYWDAQLKAKYNIEVAKNPNGNYKYLSNRGCRLFTYGHAVQWLTGKKAGGSRQLEILYEFLAVSKDPPNANSKYANYLVSQYGSKYGIKKVSVSKSWSSVKSHFDNGGVIVYNSGGHIALAVGYTERTIGGSTKQLIQLVDSSIRSTAKRVPSGVSYSGGFGTTYRKSALPGSSSHGQMWVTYSDFAQGSWDSCFSSTTAKSLIPGASEKKVDSKLRIGISTKNSSADDKCYIKKTPYEAGTTSEIIDKGGVIHITGAIENKYGNIWYITAGGKYVYSGDVTVYEYSNLFSISAKFRNTEKRNSHVAPSLDSPSAGSISTNQTVTVRRFVTNSHNNIWAELTNGSYLCFYDFNTGENKLKFVWLTDGITLSADNEVSKPTGDLEIGSNFPLRGKITTQAPILTVTARIRSLSSSNYMVDMIDPVIATPSLSTRTVDINSTSGISNNVNINSKVKFGALPRGYYRYTVSVQMGFTYGGKTFKFDSDIVCYQSDFTVDSPSTTTTPTQPDEPLYPDVGGRVPGDVNEDGKVSALDALLTLKYAARWSVTINTSNADVNADGKVSAIDAQLILKYAAKWNVVLK